MFSIIYIIDCSSSKVFLWYILYCPSNYGNGIIMKLLIYFIYKTKIWIYRKRKGKQKRKENCSYIFQPDCTHPRTVISQAGCRCYTAHNLNKSVILILPHCSSLSFPWPTRQQRSAAQSERSTLGPSALYCFSTAIDKSREVDSPSCFVAQGQQIDRRRSCRTRRSLLPLVPSSRTLKTQPFFIHPISDPEPRAHLDGDRASSSGHRGHRRGPGINVGEEASNVARALHPPPDHLHLPLQA